MNPELPTDVMTSPKHEHDFADPDDFSLVLGGPLYQAWRRLRLSDDGLRHVPRRIAISVLVLWLPLLLGSAFEGNLLAGRATVPFVYDLENQVRFLITMPLLLVAELSVHKRMLPMLRQFKRRALVPDESVQEFNAAVSSALRWRNSLGAELLILAFVYLVGSLVVFPRIALDTVTWYARPSPQGPQLSLSGTWYVFASLPLFQFLVLRWYYRLFVWTRLLRRISRIKLHLVSTHPDRVAGLGFLSETVTVLAPLALAHGALLAGRLADHIFLLDAKLTDFKLDLAMMVGFVVCIVLAPLLTFSAQLFQVKRDGRREYEALAQRYVSEFDSKWLRGGAPADEPFVGSGDIQSLADLGNSLEVVRTMRIAPITQTAVLQLVLTTLAPSVPLVLTLMPIEELLGKLVSILF